MNWYRVVNNRVDAAISEISFQLISLTSPDDKQVPNLFVVVLRIREVYMFIFYAFQIEFRQFKYLGWDTAIRLGSRIWII